VGTKCAIAIADMLTFSEAFDLKKYGWNGAPLHGPCVPAYMLRPQLFSGRKINVTVQCGDGLTAGASVADWWQITDRPRNVTYIRDGNSDGHYDLICELYARLP
jgi:purine nucleosidase